MPATRRSTLETRGAARGHVARSQRSTQHHPDSAARTQANLAKRTRPGKLFRAYARSGQEASTAFPFLDGNRFSLLYLRIFSIRLSGLPFASQPLAVPAKGARIRRGKGSSETNPDKIQIDRPRQARPKGGCEDLRTAFGQRHHRQGSGRSSCHQPAEKTGFRRPRGTPGSCRPPPAE